MIDAILNTLLHGADLPGIAVTVNRVLVGAFFAISGYHKLFNAGRHATLVRTLTELRIPCLRLNQWFVPSVEFCAGVALALGILPVIAALLIGAICLVATCTDGIRRVKAWAPIDAADAIDDVLYLPEVLYGLLILEVILTGPGPYRLDAFIL